MPAPAPLRIFISYSHDNAEHRARVRALAQQLQGEGMEVTLDQDWPAPVEGWPLWVEREVIACDLVLFIITPTFMAAFEAFPRRWPGPVVPQALYLEQSGHRPFLPVGFSDADAVYRPAPLAQQTFYSAGTERDIGVLLRVLGSLARSGETADVPVARVKSPLPPLDYYLSGVQARLTFHRRAWRYFRSKLEGLGIALQEHDLDETGAQKLVGPGITLLLNQHADHAEARLEILPGTAPVYAGLLGVVAGARQPLDCTYLVFTLQPEWQLDSREVAERLADTGVKLAGQQVLVLHGWRFAIPALTTSDAAAGALKIVPRPAYPWPLNPLRLLLHCLEQARIIIR